jgi:hypothetical protein
MMNPIIALKRVLNEEELVQAFESAALVNPVAQVVQVVASRHLSQLAMQETEQSVATVLPTAAVVFPVAQAVQVVFPDSR